MTKVFLSLGSNMDAQRHIREALAALRQTFTTIKCSPVYESEAVGFSGDNFLNLVVEVDSELALPDLIARLKAIENSMGRERGGPKFSSRVIDIDVLFYGEACGKLAGIELPRHEIYENAYVLLPMKALAPDFVDPKTGKTMTALWQSLADKMQSQKLWAIEF